MSAKYFIDTNIFVYTFDRSAPEKKRISNKLVRKAIEGGGCISYQVIQEFSNAALNKFRKPFTREELLQYMEMVLFPLCSVWPDENLYRESLAAGLETGCSWYDSLILSAAVNSGSKILYSEDLQHGRKYRNLKIVNPFI
ncbi:MAG: PIN domain-containing protein [Spirochaetia bacterium]|jgi:predicted nucleic acid-binding protein|nr:PIN domain-containing protein [Spirochaetia bacterium]